LLRAVLIALFPVPVPLQSTYVVSRADVAESLYTYPRSSTELLVHLLLLSIANSSYWPLAIVKVPPCYLSTVC